MIIFLTLKLVFWFLHNYIFTNETFKSTKHNDQAENDRLSVELTVSSE